MQHCSDRGLLRADAASKTFPHASLKIGRVLLQNFADSWGLPLARNVQKKQLLSVAQYWHGGGCCHIYARTLSYLSHLKAPNPRGCSGLLERNTANSLWRRASSEARLLLGFQQVK